MSNCKLVEFLFTALPLKKWQDFLIRCHMQKCPRCQEELASRRDILELIIREEQIAEGDGLWDGFQSKLREDQRTEKSIPASQWKWAYGVVAAFVIVAGIFVVSNISQWGNGSIEDISGDHFRINYLRIEGEPAQAYLYQPQGTDMILVWAQKSTTGE
jgi:hypothetical protein